jgi:rubrerythrin
MKCPSGKHRHTTYAKALAALVQLKRGGLGHVYECSHCGFYHVTKARPVTRKSRGRGKRRGALA